MIQCITGSCITYICWLSQYYCCGLFWFVALQEAAEGYAQLTTIRQNKDEKIAKLCDSKPRKYKYIKVIVDSQFWTSLIW